MSNNTPDYENDLVFPPQEIKSQHELSEQGRQSEVLIAAIEHCERLEKQLKIAVEALRLYSNLRGDGTVSNYESVAKSALKEIKELDK